MTIDDDCMDPTPKNVHSRVLECAQVAGLELTTQEIRSVRSVYISMYLSQYYHMEDKFPNWTRDTIDRLTVHDTEQAIVAAMIGKYSSIKGVPSKKGVR